MRGALLDMAVHDGVEIHQGDVVIFHSAWLSLIDKDPNRDASVEPGVGRGGARYRVGKGAGRGASALPKKLCFRRRWFS